MRRQPEHPQAKLLGALRRRAEQRLADAAAAPVAAHREPHDLCPVSPVLGVGAHHLHRADDDAVLDRREQHPPLGIEPCRSVEPGLARVLRRQRAAQAERHVRRVRIEQQLRELVRGGAHLVGRELRDLHLEKYLDAEEGYEGPDEVLVDSRLADVVPGAGVADLEHALLVIVAADRDDRKAGLLLPEELRRLDAVDPGHLDVHHDGVHAQPVREIDALPAVTSPPGDCKAPVRHEHRFERGEEVVVVFSDEDAVDGGGVQGSSKLAANRPIRPARFRAVPGASRAGPQTV